LNVRPLVGKLLVSRDPDDNVHHIKGTDLILWKPDDMGASAPSWAAREDRIRASGFCHMHSSSLLFERHERINLTGKRVFFERWTEHPVTIGEFEFFVIDEHNVVAYEDVDANE
jgi:hypothetical protein